MQDRMRHARGYWRKCPLRMRGEETGKAGRASLMQCGSDSGCGASVKLSDHSAIPRGWARQTGPSQGGCPRKSLRKEWHQSASPAQSALGAAPEAPSWLQKGQKAGQSANHAPCRRRRGHRAPLSPGENEPHCLAPSPSFSWEPDSPQIVRHSTAPGQDIRSTLWRARSPVFIFQGGNIFVTERRVNLWGLTYPRSDEGFWGKL